VYTSDQRETLRSALIAASRQDARISGAAVTGSAAGGAEDQWSDIDLAFGIGDAGTMPTAVADWTERMYREHGVVHHFDVNIGAWIYRVFLLHIGLQVDLAFAPAHEFGARAHTFRLQFGVAVERVHASPSTPSELDWPRMALRTPRARVRRPRETVAGGVHDQPHARPGPGAGLPAPRAFGRGRQSMDRLPPSVTEPLQRALVGRLDQATLVYAFRGRHRRPD